MLSLKESSNGFQNIYIFKQNLYQPKYEPLQKLMKPI